MGSNGQRPMRQDVGRDTHLRRDRHGLPVNMRCTELAPSAMITGETKHQRGSKDFRWEAEAYLPLGAICKWSEQATLGAIKAAIRRHETRENQALSKPSELTESNGFEPTGPRDLAMCEGYGFGRPY